MDIVGRKSILGRGTRLPQVTRLCWARSTDKQAARHWTRKDIAVPTWRAGGRRKSSRGAIEGVKTVPPDTELTSGPCGDSECSSEGSVKRLRGQLPLRLDSEGPGSTKNHVQNSPWKIPSTLATWGPTYHPPWDPHSGVPSRTGAVSGSGLQPRWSGCCDFRDHIMQKVTVFSHWSHTWPAHTIRVKQEPRPPLVYLLGFFRPQVTYYLTNSCGS